MIDIISHMFMCKHKTHNMHVRLANLIAMRSPKTVLTENNFILNET